MRRNADGSGWTITRGDLDLECAELLWTVLQAEMAVDPDNPTDTAGYAHARADGWHPTDGHPEPTRRPQGHQNHTDDAEHGDNDSDNDNDNDSKTDGETGPDADATGDKHERADHDSDHPGPVGDSARPATDTRTRTAASTTEQDDQDVEPGQTGTDGQTAQDQVTGDEVVDQGRPGPRSRAQRHHDGLKNALRRLLDNGALGRRDKVAPHLAATVTLPTLAGQPGAPPATSAAGSTLPTSLVQAWGCDASITRFVLSLGRKVIQASHTGRTLTRLERQAKHLETGHRCQGAGCPSPPGTPLVPHHPHAYALTGTTSLSDSAMLCNTDHTRVHQGQTIKLRDGRLLGPHGWITPDGNAT